MSVQALSAGCELLLSVPAEDEDAKFRCLVAVGTLAASSAECKTLANDLGLNDVATALAVSATGRVRDAAADLKAVLSTTP